MILENFNKSVLFDDFKQIKSEIESDRLFLARRFNKKAIDLYQLNQLNTLYSEVKTVLNDLKIYKQIICN